MPLNKVEAKILAFLYDERTRDIYHPPHVDRLVDLTGLPLERVELIIKFLNLEEYVYTYYAPGPVKITPSGIDFVERIFDEDRLGKIRKDRNNVLDALKSIHDNCNDKWTDSGHLSRIVGIDDRLYLYSIVDYLAQKNVLEVRRRARGSFHARISSFGYELAS